MKEVLNLAVAKEKQGHSISSGDATVHPRELLVSTSTNNPEIAFIYPDLQGRQNTPQQRNSSGVQAQRKDQDEGELYVTTGAGKTNKKKKRAPGEVMTTALTTATSRTARSSARWND